MTRMYQITQSFNKHLQLHEHKQYRQFNRFETEIEDTVPAEWLKFNTTGPRIHWKDRRSQMEVTAFGQTDLLHGPDLADFLNLFEHIRKALWSSDPRIRYYGGLSFTRHNHHEPIWKDFGDYYFLLPRYEILQSDSKVVFAINYQEKDVPGIIDELPLIFNFSDENQLIAPTLIDYQHFPGRDEWRGMIDKALNSIQGNAYEKIVLARKTKLSFTENLSPVEIIQNLKSLNPGSIYFLIQPSPMAVFIGGTPELLYQRSGNEIFSEAIAGTRMRGRNEHEDEKYESELLNSEKDRREHRFVMDNVQEILNELCTDIDKCPDVSVLKLSRVQHLYTNFRGKLKPEITDADIISQLHPTPAVGGYPADKALPEIEKLEPFRRGWYAAPVGWLSRDNAHFAVAIRSSLIMGSDMYLYSGAGIVEGSEADLEWEEINNKIANFLRVLNINGEESLEIKSEFISMTQK